MCDILLASERAIDQAVGCHEESQSLAAAGDFDSAAERLDRALLIFEEVCGLQHPDVANVLNARGVVAQRRTN